jgi:hypothetical protein
MAVPVIAQVDSTAVDTSKTGIQMNSNIEFQADSAAVEDKKKQKEPGQVTPWKEQVVGSSVTVATDSLLRWQIWPSWGDFYAYRRDAISFRQGTVGRVDAFHIAGYEPSEQQVEMEGLILNDPITGLPNYNFVPHHKLEAVTEHYLGTLNSEIKLRDYYLTKPISYLIYDEAQGDYRNLEFLVSQNFSESTNAEISFWDRRGGGYYPNNSVTGSQAFAKVYHHLNERLLIRAIYLRNQMERDEPFGYVVNDPLAFTFDEFGSVPVNSSANSEVVRTDFIAGIYQRKDSSESEEAGFELSLTNLSNKLIFSSDTLDQQVRTLNTKVFKRIEVGRLSIKGDLRFRHNTAAAESPVSNKNWIDVNSEVYLGFSLSSQFLIYGNGQLHYRNDENVGYETTAGLQVAISGKTDLKIAVSSFSRIPTIQSLYWNEGTYEGASDLENERGISLTGNFDYQLTPKLTFGLSGRVRSGEDNIFIIPDSTFINGGAFVMGNVSAYGRFENHRFAFETSGVLQQPQYEQEEPGQVSVNQQDQIIWFRNSGFIKGYVFDRASYIKVGLRSLFSPFYYSARTFNTELGYWQGNSSYLEIAPFFRLDAEISARVRGIMVVMRWENALDGIGQAGYFEAAGYPMPPRRLIVGIRAQFRN